MIVFSAVCVAVVVAGYGVAGRKENCRCFGWTALALLLVLISAASTDSDRSFSVMAPLVVSCLSFSLDALINLRDSQGRK